MFTLEDMKAGDFIDLENYYFEICEQAKEGNESNELAVVITKFFKLLNGKVPTKDAEYIDIIKEYERQLIDIKETYTWIYNPPSVMPSSIDKEQSNNQLRDEFTQDYGGYIEIIYVLCKGIFFEVPKVLEMKTKDFMFWGEYALRKRIVESQK